MSERGTPLDIVTHAPIVIPHPPPRTLVYEYELRQGNDSLRIHQDPVGDSWQAGIGATVWDCGLTLAKYAELQHQRALERGGAAPFAGVRVVELGAGTGIVGLALASLGAHVLFTDQACALPLLLHNVQQNAAAVAAASSAACGRVPCVAVAPLQWECSGEPVRALRALHADFFPPQLVIGSDCVWMAELVAPFFASIQALTDTHSRVLLSYEQRYAEVHALFQATLPPMHRRLGGDDLDADFVCDEISVFEWCGSRGSGTGGNYHKGDE